jgi:hypothetical protein
MPANDKMIVYELGTVISKKKSTYLILLDGPSDETNKGKIQHRMHQIYTFAF